MADSLFLAGQQTGQMLQDDSSVKSKIMNNARRPQRQTMFMEKSAADLMLNSTVSPRVLR